MFKANLKIELSQDWAYIIQNELNCEMESIYCSNLNSTQVLDIILFSNSKELSQLNDLLQKEDSIYNFSILEENEAYIIVKIITEDTIQGPIISKALEFDCFLTSNIKIKNNNEFWSICSKSKENIAQFIKKLRISKKVEVLSIQKYSFNKEQLSEKQFKNISKAYENGLYTIPKKTSIEELAKELEISQSTLAVHIQKAEQKIIQNYLEHSNEYIR